MSRSRRKTPIAGVTMASSDKYDKQHANRRYRHRVRVAIRKDSEVLPAMLEVSEVWTFAKEGKIWTGAGYPKLFRK